MDWFMCNVLIDDDGERVVGLLDWEKAGFIPCPRENFMAGASAEVIKNFYPWLNLFDDFDNRYSLMLAELMRTGVMIVDTAIKWMNYDKYRVWTHKNTF